MADRIHPAGDHSPSVPILAESKQLNGAYIPLQKPSPPRDQHLPPPASYRPPPARRHRHRRSCCCCCLAWIASLLTIIIVLLGITALVFYLVLRPIRAPKYNVEDVSVSQLSVDLNSSPPALSSLIAFTVRADNPNKKIGIYYDKIEIFMNYNGLQVGESRIEPFYQGHRTVTLLHSNLTTTALPVSQELANSLTTDISSQSVPFELVVRVKARVKVGALKSPRIKVRDNCRIHVSPPSAPGGARLLDKSCKLKVRL